MRLAVFCRFVIAAVLAAAVTGCLNSDKIESFGGPTMGSTYSIKYVRVKGQEPSLATLKAETEAILAEVDEQFSTYRSDSLIERFNNAGPNVCQEMPDTLIELVRAGERLNQESHGAFDLTLEPLLNLWGFGAQSRGEQVPDQAQIQQALQRVGHHHLWVEGNRLCKDVDVQVDFNSIAAGYTVDRIAQRFESLGITRYLVEVTGELKAAGRKPGGQPWRIAIEAPVDDQRVAQRVLELDGLGISTSGDYRNFFETAGRRYSHTLDPLSGAPVTHDLAAVTVADPSTLRADGLSTLLMVLGPERGFEFAERQGIAAFFVIRENQGFVVKSTRAFELLFGMGTTS